jgi:P-type Mg2+ transporter
MFTIKNLKPLSSKRASKAETYPVSWVRQIAASGTEELFEEFNTRPGGLEPDEVELARASYGANELSHKKRDPEWLRFLKAFADPFTGVLALLALVTLAGDVLFAAPEDRNPLSLLIICGMILVSGILRFVQEGKSSVAADALASSIETFCSVERAGEGVIALPLSEIVAGDIVHLQAGDIVPADACLISARDLFVGMSSLTGESLPVERVAGPAVADETVPVADLSDIVFMGSSVVSRKRQGGRLCDGLPYADRKHGKRTRRGAHEDGLRRGHRRHEQAASALHACYGASGLCYLRPYEGRLAPGAPVCALRGGGPYA